MRYVEVKDHDPGVGFEYSAMHYPGAGLYWNDRMKCYYAIINNCSLYLGGGRLPEVEAKQEVPAGVDPLALLAVALHRDAAVEFVKQGGQQ